MAHEKCFAPNHSGLCFIRPFPRAFKLPFHCPFRDRPVRHPSGVPSSVPSDSSGNVMESYNRGSSTDLKAVSPTAGERGIREPS